MSPVRSFLRFLGSELRLIFGRRRNQMGMLVLAAVPVMLAIVLKVTTPRHGGGDSGADIVSNIIGNGLYVPVAALTLETGLFLPLAIAMLAGDAVAGEANQGTLRYLLTLPAGRMRLLAVKYIAIAIGALVAVGLISLVGLIVGWALFGLHPMLTLSGSTIPIGSGLLRVLLMALYVAAGMAALGAVGLFISTLTEQPMAATITLMIVTIVSLIADQLSQIAWLHPWLLVHWSDSFIDLLRDPMLTSNMGRGLALDAGYVVVFWLAAWARFASKDITS